MAFNRSSLRLKGFRSNDVSVLVRRTPGSIRTECIERVQRFVTRAIHKRAGIPYMDYGNRFANLGLQSLEYRRVYYDLVMYYITTWLIFPLTASSQNRSGHTTSEVILVSSDPNVYPIIHFEHTFSPNV